MTAGVVPVPEAELTMRRTLLINFFSEPIADDRIISAGILLFSTILIFAADHQGAALADML